MNEITAGALFFLCALVAKGGAAADGRTGLAGKNSVSRQKNYLATVAGQNEGIGSDHVATNLCPEAGIAHTRGAHDLRRCTGLVAEIFAIVHYFERRF
jgi:hypothetical protein